ncbi:MAG: alpha/beta hydrolase [Planctomycetota bacterium]|nr:alpha/beta hydrolase [Planctomycetota bacterium]
MTLHPEAVKLLAELDALNLPPISAVSPEEARQRLATPLGPLPELPKIDEQEIAGPTSPLRARVYHPIREPAEPLNLIVFFHGGGWVVGNLDSHDGACRQLAIAAHAVVVSVDYRLAPEFPFPTAIEDCLEGLLWANQRRGEWGVQGAVCVAGDSAGGNLAAVVAIRARARKDIQLAYQVLLYPVTDCDLETESYRLFAEGYGLTRDSMRWFWQQYLGQHDWTDPEAAPLRCSSLEGLPPAYLVTAEYDTLRDEGEAYADRLSDAGVPVTRERVAGVLHGFMLHGHRFDEVQQVNHRIGQAIRQLGGRRPVSHGTSGLTRP